MKRRQSNESGRKPWRGDRRAMLCVLTALLALSCGGSDQNAPPSAAGSPTGASCLDSEGRRYSSGALMQFDAGLKRCGASGRWVDAAPAVSPAGPKPPAFCLDEQGRKYSTGAERQVGKNRLRCDASGRWVPMRQSK